MLEAYLVHLACDGQQIIQVALEDGSTALSRGSWIPPVLPASSVVSCRRILKGAVGYSAEGYSASM